MIVEIIKIILIPVLFLIVTNSSDGKLYQVVTATSASQFSAGTRDPLNLTLHGLLGDYLVHLKPGGPYFEDNEVQAMIFTAEEEIGDLIGVTLAKLGTDEYIVDMIIIEDLVDAKGYEFACDPPCEIDWPFNRPVNESVFIGVSITYVVPHARITCPVGEVTPSASLPGLYTRLSEETAAMYPAEQTWAEDRESCSVWCKERLGAGFNYRPDTGMCALFYMQRGGYPLRITHNPGEEMFFLCG